MTKTELRRIVRDRKQRLTPQILEDAALQLAAKLSAMPVYQQAKTILMYASLSDEVPTLQLIAEATSTGKHIILPAVVSDTALELRRYIRFEDLEVQGKYRIPEPVGKAFNDYDSIDLAIIPGMAFDVCGNRLGRGRGYYDRLLSHTRFSAIPKLGVCFDFQRFDSIPVETHDLPMDAVVEISVHPHSSVT